MLLNDNSIIEMRNQLIDMYQKWWKEVRQISQFDFSGEAYSNPYYSGIPDKWCDSAVRIMICGEEGFGTWRKDRIKPDDIKALQEENIKYASGSDGKGFFENKSAFWTRFKQLEYLTPDISINSIDTGIMPATAVVWSNCDRNCAADCHYNKRNGRLSPKERKALHSVETKILRKEIEILRPTHIVFLGWYEVTIKQNSLPDYTKYQKLGDKYNYPLDIKTLFCEKSEIKVYYLYHPAYRQNVKRYSEDFANVINDIKTNQNKW